MNPITFFWKSSIGKKWLIALTGLVLIGYVIGHLIGNLQVFMAPEKINGYAVFLHSMPGALWAIRIFLIACLVIHVVTTLKLVAENRAARPVAYAMTKRVQSTWASRTMAISGLVVLAFIVFHILHFTTRNIDPTLHIVDAQHANGLLHDEYDVHTMIVDGFTGHPLTTGFYILGLFLLALHLSHGFSSLLQTLGINSQKTMHPMSVAGRALAWLIFVGYAFIPIAVWIHIIHNEPSPAAGGVGSTGVPPVPAGVPPGGLARRETPLSVSQPLGERLGGTPSRTGGTPVLPIALRATTASSEIPHNPQP